MPRHLLLPFALHCPIDIALLSQLGLHLCRALPG